MLVEYLCLFAVGNWCGGKEQMYTEDTPPLKDINSTGPFDYPNNVLTSGGALYMCLYIHGIFQVSKSNSSLIWECISSSAYVSNAI